jgi:hypothetical protein
MLKTPLIAYEFSHHVPDVKEVIVCENGNIIIPTTRPCDYNYFRQIKLFQINLIKVSNSTVNSFQSEFKCLNLKGQYHSVLTADNLIKFVNENTINHPEYVTLYRISNNVRTPEEIKQHPGEIYFTKEAIKKFSLIQNFGDTLNTFEPCLVKASLITYFSHSKSDKLPTQVIVSNCNQVFYSTMSHICYVMENLNRHHLIDFSLILSSIFH